MAIPSKRGQQVTISVNVWYDPGTGRVHVTSNDPDLPPGGLHTNFRPGTQADKNVRAMLKKFGKLS
jgi:hypothetical protein